MLNWKNRLYDIDDYRGKEIYRLPPTINFQTIDGYIDFALTIINYELSIKKNKEMREYLIKVRDYFSKLYLKNTKHEKGTDFVEYCERMSNILTNIETDQECIKKNVGRFEKFDAAEEKEDFLLIVKEEDKNNISFERFVEFELMRALSKFNISPSTLGATYLTSYGCHVEIINAINNLMNIVVYLINCTSNLQEKEFYEFDKMRVEADIESFEFFINRIKNVTGII